MDNILDLYNYRYLTQDSYLATYNLYISVLILVRKVYKLVITIICFLPHNKIFILCYFKNYNGTEYIGNINYILLSSLS